ncbi:hypothetical protein D3C81_1836410 [compost metagenome]
MKVASCSWPTCTLALEPGCVTDTVPSRATVIVSVLAGMVTAGWITKPLEVTSWPFWSTWNEPSRV